MKEKIVKIVMASGNTEEIEQKIEFLINRGFELHGGLIALMDNRDLSPHIPPPPRLLFIQALVKEK